MNNLFNPFAWIMFPIAIYAMLLETAVLGDTRLCGFTPRSTLGKLGTQPCRPDTKDPLREALKQARSDFEYIRLRLIRYFEGQPAAASWKAVHSRDASRATLASAPHPAAVSQHERGEPRRDFMDEIDAAHAGSAWLEPLAHALPKHPSNEISCEKVGNDGSVRLLWHKDIVSSRFPFAAR